MSEKTTNRQQTGIIKTICINSIILAAVASNTPFHQCRRRLLIRFLQVCLIKRTTFSNADMDAAPQHIGNDDVIIKDGKTVTRTPSHNFLFFYRFVAKFSKYLFKRL